jgi:hypothetical protein
MPELMAQTALSQAQAQLVAAVVAATQTMAVETVVLLVVLESMTTVRHKLETPADTLQLRELLVVPPEPVRVAVAAVVLLMLVVPELLQPIQVATVALVNLLPSPEQRLPAAVAVAAVAT